MLRPLDVAGISLMAESGWRGDRLFRLTVEKMNGLENAPTASGPTPAHAPRYTGFLEALALMWKLSRQGLIDFEFETHSELFSAPLAISQIDGEHTVEAVKIGVEFEIQPDGRVQLASEKRVLVLRFKPKSDGLPDIARLRELLRLERERRRFEIVALEDSGFKAFQPDQRFSELDFDMRSLMGVLYFAANGVEVPEEHLEAGYATSTIDADGNPFEWSEVLGNLFHVHTADSLRRPSGAAVAVRHRGHWFYVADDDETSKTTFALLAQLFNLHSGEHHEEKPILTLPVGG
jgi:hypothetical protein